MPSQVLDKIISGALKFNSLGDAVAAFDASGYAALGWSVVSFGLKVAGNAKEAREFVFSSSEVVVGFMARYAQYERWFREPQPDEEFDRRLINVYKAILHYVMVLDDYLRQRASGSLPICSHQFRIAGSGNSDRRAL